jgi:diguanylate cyclase (GGDEF)-like protein
VAIVDPDGSLLVRVGAERALFSGLPPPAPGRVTYNLVPNATGVRTTLEIAIGIPAEADAARSGPGADAGSTGAGDQPPGALAEPPVGSVVASLPVSALLAWASPNTQDGRSIELLDGTGRVVATVGSAGGINLPGTVIEFAANGAEASEAQAAIELPGLSDWRVIASAPLPVTEIPIPAILALIALISLLVAFTAWMARRILRPAVILEAEREEFRELYEAARAAALRDSLTGLGNHRAFQEAVGQMVDQSRRYGTQFSLILLDIDEFKRINDTRGHAVGDDLLTEVGNLIRATIRTADAGYRIGGDEFAILLPATGLEGADSTTRRILTRGLDDRPHGVYRGQISFSAGITICPDLGNTRLQLTAQADAALYRGKRGGRTLVSIFDPALDRGHVDEEMRAELSAAVAAVIESGGLSPVYQPIVDLQSGRILGYEGLVRVGLESGFRHTGALFDAAEVAGRVLELDRAALEVVLRGAKAIPEEALLSVNVSPRSFETAEFNSTVFLAILRRHGISPGRVILELTERDAIRDTERLRATILHLQEAGIRVAADDVGAGNAGLRLLSQFRFDVVKIDLSLVQGGASEDQTLSVLTSLVGLARRWGALTIAEGVETAAQLQMIRAIDVDAGQGYLLARPGAILDFNLIDLDTLAGGPHPNAPIIPVDPDMFTAEPDPEPALAPAWPGNPGPAGPRRSGAGWAPLTRPAAAIAAAERAAKAAAPTAATVISTGAPNLFDQA